MKGPRSTMMQRQKLLDQALTTNRMQVKAMKAASEAIDRQAQELIALRRILISERAQLIFYTDRCVAYAERRCLDVVVPNFLDQADEVKEAYIKKAALELTQDEAIAPHEAAKSKLVM